MGCDFPCIGIGILDSYQGQGIGRTLLTQFIVDLQGLVEGLRLAVNPQNHVAISLYKRLGFNQYAIRKDGYIQMKNTLSVKEKAYEKLAPSSTRI